MGVENIPPMFGLPQILHSESQKEAGYGIRSDIALVSLFRCVSDELTTGAARKRAPCTQADCVHRIRWTGDSRSYVNVQRSISRT